MKNPLTIPLRGRRRRIIAAAAFALTAMTALSACSTGASASSTGGTTDMKVVLGWYADPESGGFYAAQSEGLYKKNDLNVSIQQGGPNVSGTTIVASGKADIGIADAASIALAQQQGIPIVAIGALYQTNPVGMIVHADSGMNSFADMQNHVWIVQTGNTAVDFLQKEKGLKFTTEAYNGSLSNFIANKDVAQQGWPTNEVYQVNQQGVKTKFFSYASAGYNPYNDVMFASKSYIAKHPEAVKKFLSASMTGWSEYMGDVKVATTANAALKRVNSQQTMQSIWYAWQTQRSYITSGDGKTQLGAMSEARWTTLVDQLTTLKVLTKKIDPTGLYDSSLLPKVAAPSNLPDAPAGSF
jgi:NitT/TauT family transport system substrate-binding protein